MTRVQNPILKGFNPDPSIVRVGDDYYIATSTFEWFPGVQIHHSKDLVNWKLVARPLNRLSQLDMLGNPDSCGVWAPCLSYWEGTFYLIYSNVRSFDGVWKDTPNYLVTTKDMMGDWSDPIFINSSGFDGSLFHDVGGKKWYTSMIVDHRKGRFFGDILMQEYDHKQRKLVGPKFDIFKGTELGCTEGPHLYRRGDFYYLLTAEGGTEYGHAITMARSKNIEGPYMLFPSNPLLSAGDYPDSPLQKCGHGDLVETKDGNWFCVFLTGRPLTRLGRCTLGRETAIAPVKWGSDDWLYLKNKDQHPKLTYEINQSLDDDFEREKIGRDDFDSPKLDINFQSLRIPITNDWLSLDERPGFLRLKGRETLNSFHRQSLIARRVQAFNIEASTCLEFSPLSFQQMAGLVCYYNTSHWYYLHVFGDEDGTSRYLQIIANNNNNMQDILETPIRLEESKSIYLKVQFIKDEIQFYFAEKESKWLEIGSVLDGSILSDDYVRDGSDRYRPAFTGTFVGLCCQDLTGERIEADFDWWKYREY